MKNLGKTILTPHRGWYYDELGAAASHLSFSGPKNSLKKYLFAVSRRGRLSNLPLNFKNRRAAPQPHTACEINLFVQFVRQRIINFVWLKEMYLSILSSCGLMCQFPDFDVYSALCSLQSLAI
jgi:hypothetical protein